MATYIYRRYTSYRLGDHDDHPTLLGSQSLVDTSSDPWEDLGARVSGGSLVPYKDISNIIFTYIYMYVYIYICIKLHSELVIFFIFGIFP